MTLINDILDFSKIEAGKLDIAQTPFALEELCRSIPAIFKEQSLAKRLDLSIDIAADVPETVVGDPSRIRQVLLNVVGNAVKSPGRSFLPREPAPRPTMPLPSAPA